MLCLEMQGLSKVYQDGPRPVEALRQVDLAVREGELVALLGPSGCGKTTLLQIAAGLEQPSAGEVRFRGQPVRGCSRERILIFQEYSLFPWLTARGNVEFGLRLQGRPARECRERALAALRPFGLEPFAEAYPHQLSGGMQQRVALARALVLEPAVLLMDEPFAAVDAITRAQLQAELRQLHEAYGQTTLLVTHSVHEALILADRVVVLSARPAEVRWELPVVRPLSPQTMAIWEEEVLRRLVPEDAPRTAQGGRGL